MNISIADRKRFFSYVSLGFGEDACWIWMGGRDFIQGRGRFWIDGCARAAPVISYILHTGIDIGKLCVCHHCDNPSCVNPNHLFLGTNEDNLADRWRKDLRKGIMRGEKCPMHKISNSDALEIRRKYGTGNYSQEQLGKLFGISQSNISYIVRNKTFIGVN